MILNRKPSIEPTEATQQMAIVEWFNIKYPKLTLFHIPNGELRNKHVAAKLKKMGVFPGVFDLYLLDFHLFIEVKRTSKDKLRESQKEFEKTALNTGHSTMTVHSIDDAIKKIDCFIEDNKQYAKNTYFK